MRKVECFYYPKHLDDRMPEYWEEGEWKQADEDGTHVPLSDAIIVDRCNPVFYSESPVIWRFQGEER